MDIGPYLGPLATVVIAALTFYSAVTSRLTRIETKMDDLAEDVKKHNSVVERVVILERDNKAIWRNIDDLKGRQK